MVVELMHGERGTKQARHKAPRLLQQQRQSTLQANILHGGALFRYRELQIGQGKNALAHERCLSRSVDDLLLAEAAEKKGSSDQTRAAGILL